MNVLLIGNSYSVDATRYLHRIARADGVELKTTCLYIGGCPIDSHFRNAMSEKEVYELYVNGEESGFCVSLKEALLNRNWDVITIQQASFQSYDYSNYQPYLDIVSEYVKKLCPRAKYYIHETWCDSDTSVRLEGFGYKNNKEMLEDIKKSYYKAAEDVKADGIIKSGELVYSLFENGFNPVWRDAGHLSLGIGRYATALLWYRTLTGNDVMNNSFNDTDVPVSEEDILKIKNMVMSF